MEIIFVVLVIFAAIQFDKSTDEKKRVIKENKANYDEAILTGNKTQALSWEENIILR